MPKAASTSCVYFHFLHKGFTLSKRTDLKLFIRQLFKREKKRLATLDYIFCSDATLLVINQEYLQHDFYTDIISFDLSDSKNAIEGEIYISIDRVKENAALYNASFRQELHRVIFHGALHLCGYNDKTAKDLAKMRKMEEKYLQLFLQK